MIWKLRIEHALGFPVVPEVKIRFDTPVIACLAGGETCSGIGKVLNSRYVISGFLRVLWS